MCYVCAKSSRIIHINQCSHIKNTPKERRIFFVGDEKLDEAIRNENPLGKKRKKYKKMSGRKQRVAVRRARQRISENYVVNLIEEWEREQADKAFAY